MKAFRRILYATDFSSASRAAFTKAIAVAQQSRAALRVMHARLPLPLAVGDDIAFVPPGIYESVEQRARREAQQRLDALVRRARKAGLRVTTLLLDGVPHEQILRAARRSHADLIVLGTHGRSGFSRAFLGSVAERVIRLAPCPVLAVRGR